MIFRDRKKFVNQLETGQTMKQIVWSQFKEHKLAVAGASIISLFVVIALFAPVISMMTGIDPYAQNLGARYQPPFTVSSASSDVRESSMEKWILENPQAANSLQADISAHDLIPVAPEDALYELALMETEARDQVLAALKNPYKSDLLGFIDQFETFHFFGTDDLGRDVLMRLIYGTRVSMGFGVMVALVSAMIGLLIGALAGYYGGILDSILMRTTDALLSLPHIPFLIVLAAIDLTKIELFKNVVTASNQSILKLVIILCLFSWMTVARLVRGSILSIREREFVLASKTLGATDFTIITRHMFPNVLAPMLVSITLGVGESILYEAALSFLGLGIMPPTPSWGNMLNNAQQFVSQAPTLAIMPGLLILFTVVSFNFVGDGLQDAIDPKSIRR